ncbi:MAG: peptidase M19, partial [Gammaproteobacteria bacterium]
MRAPVRLLVVFSGLLIAGMLVLRFAVLPHVDARLNTLHGPVSQPVAANVQAFHANAFVADMHADSLLWGRDLERRHQRGHVDLPR